MIPSHRQKVVSIISEGQGEIRALPALRTQLQKLLGVQFTNPIFASVDPQAPPARISRELVLKIRHAIARRADIVVVLLDSERTDRCPGERAKEISAALAGFDLGNVHVVLKHVCFENWLISDREAFSRQRALFPRADLVKFSPGSADRVHKPKELIESALGPTKFYSKTCHPPKILAKADIKEMRRNSGSFDKFLRTVANESGRLGKS